MFLMWVTLPDRPGSLGSVATAMGGVGADINAVEIVEKGDGIVVDDFIVDLPPGQLPETIVTACQSLSGVPRRVDLPLSRGRRAAVRPRGSGADNGRPGPRRGDLGVVAPFRFDFATLIEVIDGKPRLHRCPLRHARAGADPDGLTNFLPFHHTHRINLRSGWIPGWADTTVMVSALNQDRAIAIGRIGGPEFLDSEIARLHHLAALVK